MMSHVRGVVRKLANVGCIVVVLLVTGRLVAAVHHHRTGIGAIAPTITIAVDGTY